jgi:hypothetical protein
MFFLSFQPFVLFDPAVRPSAADPIHHRTNPVSDPTAVSLPKAHDPHPHHDDETAETCRSYCQGPHDPLSLVPKLAEEEKPRVKEQRAFEQWIVPTIRRRTRMLTADAYAGDLLWGAPLPFWRASWLLTERLPIPDDRKANGSFSLCE